MIARQMIEREIDAIGHYRENPHDTIVFTPIYYSFELAMTEAGWVFHESDGMYRHKVDNFDERHAMTYDEAFKFWCAAKMNTPPF